MYLFGLCFLVAFVCLCTKVVAIRFMSNNIEINQTMDDKFNYDVSYSAPILSPVAVLNVIIHAECISMKRRCSVYLMRRMVRTECKRES